MKKENTYNCEKCSKEITLRQSVEVRKLDRGALGMLGGVTFVTHYCKPCAAKIGSVGRVR